MQFKQIFFAGFLLIAFSFMGCRPEDSLIFHPSAEIVQTPRHAGLEFQDLFFTTADGVRLNGWFIPHPEARATMVWFHGNAGNISHRVENIKLLYDKVKINIFIFDYRGYGRSAGSVSEEGTYRDGAAALDFVKKQLRVDVKNLIIFGRSLGAAVAAEMALRFESRGLILETPFMSIREMAKTIFPILPIGALLQTRYDVVEKVGKIKVPLLVLHGDRDDVVPYEQGKKVFAAAGEPKEFYTIGGATHNDTYLVGGDAYFQRLRSFVETVVPTEP
ncbi:MAG: alpha/beta hydrolase [Candidatus Binatia bacterium]